MDAYELGARWGLTQLEPLEGATCSVVLAGIDSEGREVVLKLPEPDSEERSALPVLEAFSGHGGVSILRSDAETGATLMLRLRPGFTLAEAGDSATAICAAVIRRLRSAPVVERPSIGTWFEEFDAVAGEPLVAEAVRVSRWLLETSPTPVLLHGDLHHFNVLRHGEDWVAIDPKGMQGDPAFEVTGFMRNSLGDPPLPEEQVRRLGVFAELLGDPVERLWGWSFCQTRLSAAWCDPGEAKAIWGRLAEELWEIRGEVAAFVGFDQG